uniref:valine N-monooxygenase 1-like n=1 Tax=Erigeron canadensis TaxID=72917 RepID=UPI001CB929E4|nr:valine N-monooxygenase 1-like [Erigeron canadensis]
MTMQPSIIMGIIFFFLFIAKLVKKKISTKSYQLPPGPNPLPFLGSMIQLLQNKPIFRWIHKLMDDYNSPIICLHLGPSTHVIAVSCPTIACEFLKTQDEVFASRPATISAYLISNNYRATIMSPLGDQWKMMKGIVNDNMLSSWAHKWLQPKRDEEANHLLCYISNQIQKGALVNIRIASQHFCANVIKKLIFGKRFFGEGHEDGGPGVEDIEHISALFTILRYLYGFSISNYFPWLRGRIELDGHDKIMRDAIKIVQKYHDPLIDERIQAWKKGARNEVKDLLDKLITLDNPKLTPEEIKAQILELMIATIDNPSNAVEWVMAEMMKEPLILKRAVQEIDNVVGCNRLVEEYDVPQLNYIKSCIKESFRLHPYAPFNVPHLALKDTIVAGYFIPKGSHVLLSRLGLGRNPNVWNDPMRFDPDRHLGMAGKQVALSDHELRILSFSTGKRGCPGVVLGTTITTMLLARMIQGFKWETPHNEPQVKLIENHDNLLLAEPLIVVAKPRLPQQIYPTI